MEFVVKIIAKPSVSDEVLKLLLARAFSTAPKKFDDMLDHMPPIIVARKSTEAEAKTMASKFESLGFQVEVLERDIPLAVPAPDKPVVESDPQRVQSSQKNPTAVLPTLGLRKPVAVDNLGEGVLALPSKRATRWPTLPSLLNRTIADKPPTPADPTVALEGQGPTAQSAKAQNAKAQPKAQSPQAPEAPIPNPQSLPTQVVEPDRIDTLVERTPRRLSLQSRIFLAGALPMLLSIILVGLTLHQAVPPMLHTLMQGTARTSAMALATAVQPLLHNQSDRSNPLLGQTLGASQQGLQGQKVEFVFLTDTKGNPLQGWNAAGEGRETLPQDLLQPLKAQASLSANGVTSQVVVLPDQTIVMAAAPLMAQGQTVGSLVMGINALGFAEGFQDVLRNVLLVGLLPVFLAILAALMVTRRMARTVMQLTRAADRIGMGDLSTEIGVRTGDELELLSHAMDRMRVGLQKHIERQKRR